VKRREKADKEGKTPKSENSGHTVNEARAGRRRIASVTWPASFPSLPLSPISSPLVVVVVVFAVDTVNTALPLSSLPPPPVLKTTASHTRYVHVT
jgi:hypothetical protein